MPTVRMSNGIDSRTGRLVASYENENTERKYVAARFVAQCVLSSGLAPSYAFCTAPIAKIGPGNWDQKGLKCAMKRDGPAGQLKLLTRAEISYEEQSGISARLMTGWLVSIAHQFNVREDSCIMQVHDDRIILDKFTVSGCLCFDPRTHCFYWDLKRPCIFNALGWPNCVDSPLGPVFAPCHRFGYSDNFQKDELSDAPGLDTSEPEKGDATERARSFDCDDAAKYLRLVHWSQHGLPPMPVDVGLTKLPPYINWPESLGNVFGRGNDRRVLKHESMQGEDGKGLGLGQALQKVARKAGAFDIYMKSQPGFRSELTIVDLNPGQNTGTILPLPDYIPGIRNCIAGGAVSEGHIVESAVDYFHEVCMEGDAPSVELMVSMPQTPLENNPEGVIPGGTADGLPIGLMPAWSNRDQKIAKIWIVRNSGDHDQNFGQAFGEAWKLYPWWLCAYKLAPGFNPWKGTKWDKSASGGICMNNGGPIRFKPFLNSGYQMDSSSPANWQPREVVFEMYKNEVAEIDDRRSDPPEDPPPPVVEWQKVSEIDNLTLSADSTIVIVTGLRRDQATYYIKNVFDDDGYIGHRGDNIFPRPMRANVALEGDWPLTGRKGKDDPNSTVDRVSGQFKYCWRVPTPPGDYQELLRRPEAFPVGKAKIEHDMNMAVSFPPHCTEGSELFTDRKNENEGLLPKHAATRLRDVKRIAYYAKLRIPRIAPAWRPGITIEIKGKSTILCKTVVKSVTFSMVGTSSDPKETPAVPDTWLECGPPDMAVLMGDPAAGHAIVSGGPTGSPTESSDEYPGDRGEDHTPGNSGGYTTPGSEGETGGASQTQETKPAGGDEYEYEKGFKPKAPAAGEKSAPTVTSDEQKTSTPGTSSSWSTPGKSSSWSTPGSSEKASADAKAQGKPKGSGKPLNARQQEQKERKERKDAERKENAKQHRQDKAQQRAGNGVMIDAQGNAHNSIMGKGTPGFGEASSGSMTDASGKTHTGIMGKGQPGFGEPGSGRMGDVTDLNQSAKSMFDTSKADAHDRKTYKPTPRDNDPGALGAIAKSFGRQDAFKRQQIEKAKPPAAVKEVKKDEPLSMGKSESGIKKSGESLADYSARLDSAKGNGLSIETKSAESKKAGASTPRHERGGTVSERQTRANEGE